MSDESASAARRTALQKWVNAQQDAGISAMVGTLVRQGFLDDPDDYESYGGFIPQPTGVFYDLFWPWYNGQVSPEFDVPLPGFMEIRNRIIAKFQGRKATMVSLGLAKQEVLAEVLRSIPPDAKPTDADARMDRLAAQMKTLIEQGF